MSKLTSLKSRITLFVLMIIALSFTTANAGLTKTEVSQLFVALFNRASEGNGNAFFQTSVPEFEDMAKTDSFMLTLQVVKDYFGPSFDDDQAFVELIFKNTLNRLPTDGQAVIDGIAFWVGALEQGYGRGFMVSELIKVIYDYGLGGQYYNPEDAATLAAHNQFTNRVAVSDYLADNQWETLPDYETVTRFGAEDGLNVTDDPFTVGEAKYFIDIIAKFCSYSITPSSGSFTSSGGTSLVSVTASNSSCAWTASESLDWVSLSPPSGTGSGSVTVTVATNTGAARTGSVTIAGQPYTISQAAAPCTYSISPSSGSFTSSGGTSSISVTASNSSCAWTASESLDWVSLSPTSGTGNGSVTVTVTANTGATRSGSVTIAGQAYAISQTAAAVDALIGNFKFVFNIGASQYTDRITMDKKGTDTTSEGTYYYYGYNADFPTIISAVGAWSPSLSAYLIATSRTTSDFVDSYLFSINADNTLSGTYRLSNNGGSTWSSGFSFLIPESYKIPLGSFTNQYAVTVNSTPGGNTNKDGANTVNHGDSITITATPVNGYIFIGWSGDASGTMNPLTVSNITSAKNITANFQSISLSGDCYNSSIVSPTPFMGNNGEIFRLHDGSLWEVKYEYEYLYEYYPTVIICPSQGKLLIDGKSLNVQYIGNLAIESQIDGVFEGWDGNTIVKLINGQTWQQTEYYYTYHYAFMPKVLIYRSSGQYKMKVDGVDKAIGVVRLQ